MKIIKLAEILAAKYKFAVNAVDLESSLRRKIPVLWNYPNKLFAILKACADSGLTNAKTPEEKKAYAGYKFCKELLSNIDYIKANWLSISLAELKDKLENIVNLINSNKNIKFGPTGRPVLESDNEPLVTVQFPHVAELIYLLYPISTKSDKKNRDDSQNKARTGLSRILSFSLSMLDELNQLELMEPQKFVMQKDDGSDYESLPERFKPQRSQLSIHDIMDFIRQHGEEYGITSNEDWGKVFLNDPLFKEDITTVINAINRGHYPRGSSDAKREIDDILKRQRERKAKSNAHLFEDTE